jgi:hypothetical protein
MIDKNCQHFARQSIDKFFISEICDKSSYAIKKIAKEEKEVQTAEAFELVKGGINSFVKKGGNMEDLILLIESRLDIDLIFSPLSLDYTNLKKNLGQVTVKYELENDFSFALVSKKDLVFH